MSKLRFVPFLLSLAIVLADEEAADDEHSHKSQKELNSVRSTILQRRNFESILRDRMKAASDARAKETYQRYSPTAKPGLKPTPNGNNPRPITINYKAPVPVPVPFSSPNAASDPQANANPASAARPPTAAIQTMTSPYVNRRDFETLTNQVKSTLTTLKMMLKQVEGIVKENQQARHQILANVQAIKDVGKRAGAIESQQTSGMADMKEMKEILVNIMSLMQALG